MQRILLFDAMNLYIRSFAVLNFSDDNGDHVGGTVGTLQSVRAMIELFHPTKVVFCWDGKNSGKERRTLLPEYKEGRKVRKSLNRTFQWETPDAEWVAFKKQLYRVKEYLETMPIFEVEIENMEADDVIAYIATNKWLDDEKIIISSDRDYFQLITEKISVYRPVKKELITYETMMKENKIYPPNWILLKVLCGDSSDNIPPIARGLGQKTAVKLFPFLSETHKHTIDDVIAYCEANKESGKMYQAILDNKDKLDTYWKVMQLGAIELTLAGLNVLNESLEAKPIFKPFQLRLMFIQDNAFKQLNQFASWNRLLMPLNTISMLKEANGRPDTSDV